jgi:predicted dinucleotide-binding enzyme
MKVGVLGTGDVGRSLGTAFVTLGHEVMMGAREAGR